ncbi:nucleotidyl transferase AbiEii/AbiGii toxin family protein [Flagellimonas alvinocaridis]|uniref:Nucleotidyl transferase AbiEii/AbiGii toxin family protein n=1 Tax=Flagellimonas alvinocaridis TaxID=2530200 RepID=A0A4S8RUE0_9FLAO|nr:nucleotidyl transferase AbiEii/AbiGii toxin family protein [Allomuricauda alvinocaridis]THV60825.1 nucleotidyl transferase AbiEii/AbiGii toxin family protein [Allomuricauda alvinocaridis]
MIPRRYITEWKANAPWPTDAQVEQDLVIERALIALFSDPFLKEHVAFRGGTALHKIYLKPQARYSEDIDLVQIKEVPIKPILQAIRKQLDFLGTKRNIKQNINMNTASYRFESEIPPVVNMRLKIEINTREHFTVMGYTELEHSMENGWFSGSCSMNSFSIEELLATKLRALYQRRKGRDLFDLFHAMTQLDVNTQKLVNTYREYMNFSRGQSPTQKQFLLNMDEKIEDPDFGGDIYALLRPDVTYNQKEAYQLIKSELLEQI